ncbi:unnamed protein product [Allacma fusca]|uniref:Major facilitator superfamily (MFS) profile domain-containing protein n=1 Tax=Allacma fusca TaxID=39272 RepID=A0A8J2KWG7_9HEXA|nr:unnamed protein product [Allacma fusca]
MTEGKESEQDDDEDKNSGALYSDDESIIEEASEENLETAETEAHINGIFSVNKQEQILNVTTLPKKVRIECKLNNIDDVLEELGGFGKFQFMMLIFLLGFEIPTAFLVFIPVFIGATPSIWLCDNETISRTDACTCEGQLYPLDSTVSIVTEWKLICSTSWVSDTIVSLQMLGMMFGSICVSQLSDWYGRRYVFLTMVLQMIVACILTATAPNAWVYAAARFLCGGAFAGFLTTTAIYSMEFLTPKWRQLSSVGPFGEGTMLLGVIAYFLRPWRTLVWVTLLPFTLIVVIFPFVPESPRWLLRNQKFEKCHTVLKYIARVNGKAPISMETLKFIAEKERPASDNDDGKVERFSYFIFCRDKNLRKTTLYLQGIWFMWALVYFGISYNIKNLAGNPYLNVILMGGVDAIGYPTSFLVNIKIGRRKALVTFMTITAIFLVAIAILLLTVGLEGHDSLRASLYFIGKFGTAGARSACRTLTGESFPTAVRTMGIAMASITASLGAAVSPQLAYIGAYWPSVPFFVLAAISVTGSLMSFLLTETSGKPLQEMQDKKIRYKKPAQKYGVGTIVPMNNEDDEHNMKHL